MRPTAHIRKLAATVIAITVATGITTPAAASTDAAAPPLFLPFLLDQDRYVPIKVADPTVGLAPAGINDRGVIVGEYVRPTSESAFVRTARGRITTFNVPGAAGSEATDISDRGVIAGTYSDDTPIVNNSAHPYGYLLDNSRFTRIDVPGAAGTSVQGVDDHRRAIGTYADSAGTTHGFRWEHGHVTVMDVPGAASTALIGVNERGQIVGQSVDATGQKIRSFRWDPGHAKPTTIRRPGAAYTFVSDINDRGQIAGYTADDLDLNGARGFVLSKGKVAPVNFPGVARTAPLDLNDRGTVVGIYENPAAGTGRTRTLPVPGLSASR